MSLFSFSILVTCILLISTPKEPAFTFTGFLVLLNVIDLLLFPSFCLLWVEFTFPFLVSLSKFRLRFGKYFLLKAIVNTGSVDRTVPASEV